MNENSTCYMSSIMSGVGKSYVLGCVNPPVSKDNPLHTALYSLSEGGGGVLPYMAYTGMCRWTILFFTSLS